MSSTTLQKIAQIEEELSRMQKNKATAKHYAVLKSRMAKLKTELLGAKTGGGGGAKIDAFEVAKSGDTRIGLVGFPSVGKSTLLTKLTGTFSESADYEFTTVTAVGGSLKYKGAKIQVVDLPGIIEGAADNKGRGRQIIATARTCDVIMVVLDAQKPLTHKKKIEKELERFHIRLNKSPPNITYKRRDKGGISFTHTLKERPQHLDLEIVTSILREYKIHNATVALREDITADDLIDVVEGNVAYIPCIYVLNKIDAISMEELELLDKVPHYVPISAKDGWNFDELLEKIWDYAKCIRIYTKPKGTIPNYDAPVILHSTNPTVENFCDRLHKTIKDNFKYANVWGTSVKHNPQKVGLSHVLNDEDIVQIIKKS
jgi:small GTP-binding protein